MRRSIRDDRKEAKVCQAGVPSLVDEYVILHRERSKTAKQLLASRTHALEIPVDHALLMDVD